MRGFKLFGGMVATALAVAILPVTAASAAKQLTLSASGTPVTAGSPGHVVLGISQCFIVTNGSVAVNNASTDKVTGTENLVASCSSEGESISGTFSETLLGATGKMTLKGTITITTPGPCVYEFKKFKTKFTVPGSVFAEGTAGGKLSKKISAPTCEKKVTDNFLTEVTGENTEEPLEAAL